MPLGTFAPGEYTMTYGGAAVGICTSGGKHLRLRHKGIRVDDTDTYGSTLIDGIYRGMACTLTCVFKEWNAGVKAAIWPASTTLNGAVGVIGRLWSSMAASIVLTATTGTPAATNGPATLTAGKAILAEENDVDVLFGPDERDVPVVFNLLAYDDSGTIRLFAVT